MDRVRARVKVFLPKNHRDPKENPKFKFWLNSIKMIFFRPVVVRKLNLKNKILKLGF